MKATTTDKQWTPQAATAALNLDHRLAFSLRETATILGISPSSTYRLLKRGQLRSTPGLRRKLISREDLLCFLRS